ncbi:MAG: AAA family ATPase [Acidimicrobiales bacterium]
MSAITDAWPLVEREGELGELDAAVASDDAAFVLVYGPAGVGKTRLADECLRRAEHAGARTARIVATGAAAALPLGAMAPLLPRDLGPEVAPADLLARTCEEVSGDRRLLVMVDDAHLLDGSSAVLLTQLADLGAIELLATVRTGEVAPDAVAGWWRSERARRFDLGELPVEAVGHLLGTVLGGPVARDLVHRMHQASGGNPLLLRELLIEADRAGLLSDATGTWRVAGELPPSRRLQDLLADRLGALGDEERDALDRLACAGPLGPDELAADHAVEALERHGLVRCSTDERRTTWELANPVLGEVLRAQLPKSTRRQLLLECAERIEATGARRRDDAFRVATWRLDAGGGADAHLLLQAARVARYAHDYEAVRRLARTLRLEAPSAEADVLLGEACYELGEFQEAEAVLAGPGPDGTPPDLVVRRATVRTKNLQWGLSDWPTALEVVAEAIARVRPAHAPELLAEEASVRMFSGRPQDALDVIAHRRAHGTGRGDVRARRGAVAGVRRAHRRGGGLRRAWLPAPLGARRRVGAGPPRHPRRQPRLRPDRGGPVRGGRGAGGAGHDVAVAEHLPIAQIWFAMLLARSTGLRGRPASSRDWAVEATSTARLHGFDGPRRIALSALAVARAVLGDAAGATEAADELSAWPPTGSSTTTR